jgi:hypothetical protein
VKASGQTGQAHSGGAVARAQSLKIIKGGFTMKRRKGWKGKLTKKELAHIKETTDNGLLREFKANRAKHQEWKAKGEREACWECRFIAKKLGLES